MTHSLDLLVSDGVAVGAVPVIGRLGVVVRSVRDEVVLGVSIPGIDGGVPACDTRLSVVVVVGIAAVLATLRRRRVWCPLPPRWQRRSPILRQVQMQRRQCDPFRRH